MSSIGKLEKLTQNYIHLTLVEQRLEIIDELLTNTTQVNTEFGSSVGVEGVKQNYKDWFNIFKNINIDITDVYGSKSQNVIVCQFKQIAMHNGHFKGIPPTGCRITFDTCVMYRFEQHRILDYHVSCDLVSILKQIGLRESMDLEAVMTRPLLYRPDQGIVTLQDFSNTKKLSVREIECLALYLNSKSAKSIAQCLGVSHRTVEFYLSKAMTKMHCTSKQQLIDQVLHLGIKHLFDKELYTIYNAYTKYAS